MRVNFFMLIISLVVSALIFYGFHVWSGYMVYSIFSSFISLVLLSSATAVRYTDAPRTTVMTRVFTLISFFVMLLADILMAFLKVSDPTFIIVNGLALCVWAVGVYSMSRVRQ